MTVVIRPARRDDVPGILAIYNDAVLNTTGSYDETPQSFDTRLAWYENNRHHGYPMFVAEDAGVIAGYSALSAFRPRHGYRFTCEDSIYVATSHRGQGLGARLLTPVITQARAMGMHCIIAVIGDAANTASIRLHERLGFVQVARLPEVGFKFGRWLDQVWLQLILT
jgi:L-amino acid N-acyltransferase